MNGPERLSDLTRPTATHDIYEVVEKGCNPTLTHMYRDGQQAFELQARHMDAGRGVVMNEECATRLVELLTRLLAVKK